MRWSLYVVPEANLILAIVKSDLGSLARVVEPEYSTTYSKLRTSLIIKEVI